MGRLLGFAMGKFLFTVAFTFSTFVMGTDAHAGVQWCESDPVFVVNGSIIDVTTAFPVGYESSIKEPILIELLVPKDANAAVVSLPSAVPMRAKISKVLPSEELFSLGTPVIVEVTVKASASFETRTRIAGTYLWFASTVYGKSNVTTQVRYTLIGL